MILWLETTRSAIYNFIISEDQFWGEKNAPGSMEWQQILL